MVSKVLVNESKIAETILRLAASAFTPHDFIDAFKRFFPEDWRALVERFGVFGGGRRSTVSTCFLNRLMFILISLARGYKLKYLS